jgi:hypothetical protein
VVWPLPPVEPRVHRAVRSVLAAAPEAVCPRAPLRGTILSSWFTLRGPGGLAVGAARHFWEALTELSDPQSNWATVEKEIANLLEEMPREDPYEQSPSSDVPSPTCGLLRAALVIGGATVVISLVSPYLAWFAALLGR